MGFDGVFVVGARIGAGGGLGLDLLGWFTRGFIGAIVVLDT